MVLSFFILIQFGTSILGAMVGGMAWADILSGIATLILVIPVLAVGARRLHDISKS